MKTRLFIILFLSQILGSSIWGQFISNSERLQDIRRMLAVQQKLTAHSRTEIWHYLQKPMTQDAKQAMRFLYAYMPLSDMADYSPSFFYKNVQRTLEARAEMPWGKKIPEDVFLHFVLPLRVNNEHLDSFRLKMYPILKARIQGLDMKEAALEINHWCHEKVTYRGTDDRTSSPLNTMNKSFGRCGEESTFTVAALRTVGIPARQVYTPRWAHSDDNHAWVEVWINGKWHYMGACEPAPDLDMGWFSEPVKRIMLADSRAFGRYYGQDQVVVANDRFSNLNLTSNYAPVRNVTIKVMHVDGTPVDSAKVEFKLYNYAEYYPIATTYTDKSGQTHLSLGLGDILIWASKNGIFGYAKLSVPTTGSLTLVLDKTSLDNVTDDYYMVPPPAQKVMSHVTPQQEKYNDLRLAHEDSIRNAYMATFKDSLWAGALAQKLHLSSDTVVGFIQKSYGNWAQVETYLSQGAEISRKYVLAMAAQLSDKDFSDLRASVLISQLRYAVRPEGREQGISDGQFIRYVLNPRIATENLSAWRSFLSNQFGYEMVLKTRDNIHVLINWMQHQITINDDANVYSHSYISPEGVFLMRLADKKSRDLFFVAACRTFGIPARLNPETQFPEYMKQGKWLRAVFSAHAIANPVLGSLHLLNGDNPMVPQYYLHFTIGELRNGTYHTLYFDEDKKVTDFPQQIPLAIGHYVLVTGNRLQDGSVLSSLTYFQIKKGQETTIKVQLRQPKNILAASGKLNLNDLYIKPLDSTTPVSLASLSGGKDMALILLDPDKEPSKHILNDLGSYINYFNQGDVKFVFAMSQMNAQQSNELATYALPANRLEGIDLSDHLVKAISAIYNQGSPANLPLVLLMDKAGQIYYFSAGYKIGIGEQLLRIEASMKLRKKENKNVQE
ncbi:transglutaminase-like domain-containing protein [Microbacter margulisiae]|uniref:Transglutaminase-like domain-containing protein n=1 Tax=Microbacter margulisiae TaxID=1350067 RepID=A0A7W5H1K5_9PORP|nr:transglutaminase-like domain-containing protein [Microbacter margulisiae]MBB3186785.1 hypothetical protein [Microbacter margulisiae]